jgi:hypothetical protein
MIMIAAALGIQARYELSKQELPMFLAYAH